MPYPTIIIAILASLIAIAIGFAIGYASRKKIAENKLISAENEVDKILENAKSEARAIIREKTLEAKEEGASFTK